MSHTVSYCRHRAAEFLKEAAYRERCRSPLAPYFRHKAAMWLRRAARCYE